MGAYGMLLLLVGSMVVAQLFKLFLTWRPRNSLKHKPRRRWEYDKLV
jgi:hypothetical protein